MGNPGYLLMLAPKEILDGQATNYIILDRWSFRLPRISRSSLNAECDGQFGIHPYVNSRLPECWLYFAIPRRVGDQQNCSFCECQSLVRFNSCWSSPTLWWQKKQNWSDDCEGKDASVPNLAAMGFKWGTICWWNDKTIRKTVAHRPPSNTHVQTASRWKFHSCQEEDAATTWSQCR